MVPRPADRVWLIEPFKCNTCTLHHSMAGSWEPENALLSSSLTVGLMLRRLCRVVSAWHLFSMAPENRGIPDWARRDRQADPAWIQGNPDVFSTAAAFEDAGPGAVVVDTTLEPIPGAGASSACFSQEQLEEQADEDAKRIVCRYDPAQELVLVLGGLRGSLSPPSSRLSEARDAPEIWFASGTEL